MEALTDLVMNGARSMLCLVVNLLQSNDIHASLERDQIVIKSPVKTEDEIADVYVTIMVTEKDVMFSVEPMECRNSALSYKFPRQLIQADGRAIERLIQHIVVRYKAKEIEAYLLGPESRSP